jgi:predicted  nucleic acid-binding Zn-ribbon protein
MKKVLLSLLAVAALVLSCQNYDDEFAALNTKIASLESQITSLAELRTAVTGVQSSISSLQSAVAAAQAAAEAAGDAAEAAGDANAAAAAANADSIAALATSISSIAADLVDLQTAINAATTEADLDALKDELNTTLAALQALVESNSASIAALVANDASLKAALDELGVDVNSVLAANASFEGDLTITNASQLAYAKSLGIKVATIKGNVTVLVDETDHTGGGDGEGLTAEEVNTVLSQILYVVGNVKITADEEVDLSGLTSISGDYIVIGHDASDDNLLSVGGDVHFDHDGPYSSKIAETNNIYLVAYPKVTGSATVTGRTGTTSIDFLETTASSLQTVSSTVAGQHTSGSSIT